MLFGFVLLRHQAPGRGFGACRIGFQFLREFDQAWCNRVPRYRACFSAGFRGEVSMAQRLHEEELERQGQLFSPVVRWHQGQIKRELLRPS